ncbi:GPMC system MBL fold metallohydrolase [Geobacter sp. SVR]|uniref:GPMC system MBL fold metallohydrolase n=1 Tax=Geobacter sp. SVR TaxID=2495594 RepID=UPI00143EFDC4|nr:GPMC system MBL fold metallohydrolase [Geobacter sp. SVR]BCS55848.1 MBL fold metallo-hydrolase [Geobacter sp. SVR]GCF83852.1 MBL fold metallo-hydrolase [Geobacter sp. SVR]
MKVTILGSGTSTGVPMVGCTCRVCSSDDPRDNRTRASLLIRHDSRTILIDTSTDFRRQALRERLASIDAVLFTHSHADHVNGIDDLRGFHFAHRRIVPCFASSTASEILLTAFPYIFNEIEGSGYTPIMHLNEIRGPFDLFGLNVTPIPLVHGLTTTMGYRIGSFAYLTDCNAIPAASLSLLQGLDVLVIDGLRWKPHPFHFHIEAAIAAAEQLNPRRTILTHLSHDVLHADSGKLPQGVEFAYDGLKFTSIP